MRRFFALTIFILAASFALPSRSTSAPPATSPIAESWIAAWNSHDPAKWATHFTADVYYEDVTFAQISHGAGEAKKFATETFADVPDLRLELENSSGAGDHAAIQWVLTGTDKGFYKTGKPFKVRGVSVITITNGKISRSVDYYDAATIMKQVGLLPTP